MTQSKRTTGPLKTFWNKFSSLWKKETNVYFIPGMCYNCKVFDKLRLPKGFRKVYIEWYTPRADETLRQYAREMAHAIDTRKPFILVGYSFGAVIMQEMSHFLSPQKSIIISSFKKPEEVPMLFRAVKRANIIGRIPDRLYSSTDFITNAFNQMVYHMPTSELSEYMTCTDPVYIKWAISRITNWIPNNECRRLYHIHGTEDQVFPYENIDSAYPVEDGDHLMVLKKADVVSSILGSILLMK